MLYRSLLRPLLFRLPAETAHELALHSLSSSPNLVRSLLSTRSERSPFGPLRRFGLTFKNPVGLAAGFDKNGVALPALAALGFGFIEAGTVTYHAQSGNKRPRLFRLPKDQALINRAGFNNRGAAAFARVAAQHKPECILGVSIGKSKKVSMEAVVKDYLGSLEVVYPVADYIAVNVSSPNTPHLRELQASALLGDLLHALQKRGQQLADKLGRQTVPILVKLSPDLSQEDLQDIVAVVQQNEIAGLIATNTTIARTGLRTIASQVAGFGAGGLSGAPLKPRSLRIVATLHNLTNGAMPIIGVGGIFTAEDAWQMISAGASLVQVYTGFIYQGPSIVTEINDGLRRIVSREGFVSLDEAVGCRAKSFA